MIKNLLCHDEQSGQTPGNFIRLHFALKITLAGFPRQCKANLCLKRNKNYVRFRQVIGADNQC